MNVIRREHQSGRGMLSACLTILAAALLLPAGVQASSTFTGSVTAGTGTIQVTVAGTLRTITASSYTDTGNTGGVTYPLTFTPGAGFAISGASYRASTTGAVTTPIPLTCPGGTAAACTYNLLNAANNTNYTITASFAATRNITTSISHLCGGSNGGTISPAPVSPATTVPVPGGVTPVRATSSRISSLTAPPSWQPPWPVSLPM